DPSVTASTLAGLQALSGGRMDLGIGRGDSALRVLGKPPQSLEHLEQAATMIRDLCAGREVSYEGTPIRLTWAPDYPLPVWIAGYGPKALAITGRIADGAILQIGDPELIGWCVGLLRAGAREAGRDPNEIAVMAAAPADGGAPDEARERS